MNRQAFFEKRVAGRATHGFTLIELLVIIAIISILAAILFPVFGRARENARRSSCQSGLKQFGLAFMQYTQDYDERYPKGLPGTPTGSMNFHRGSGWGGQIYHYVKNRSIFMCPSFSSRTSGGLNLTYGYNAVIPLKESYGSGGSARRVGADGQMSALNSPPRTVLLFEASGRAGRFIDIEREGRDLVTGSGNEGSPAGPGLVERLWTSEDGGSSNASYATGCLGKRKANCYFLATGTDAEKKAAGMTNASQSNTNNYGWGLYEEGRHLEGSNFLMADGHVKWYKPDNVSTGYVAINSTNAQSTLGTDHRQHLAQGTDYNGDDAFQVTFSTR
jgi:prepilin-type N-terminal cleavage/methylation domain-containing protein/prepilin-type processing-associated H-X9-DG protein